MLSTLSQCCIVTVMQIKFTVVESFFTVISNVNNNFCLSDMSLKICMCALAALFFFLGEQLFVSRKKGPRDELLQTAIST